MNFSNTEVAAKLRRVAAAYTLKKIGNYFQIRAYENAASSIEHATSDIKDLWERKQLDQLPGVGPNIQQYLEELYSQGKVKHWEEVEDGIPEAVFDFLDIPGVGPQTALKLSKMGAISLDDLGLKLRGGELEKRGLPVKTAKNIEEGIARMRALQSGRMMLPMAFLQAEKVLAYLKQNKSVEEAEALGSLRRMVATIGDLDFAVASSEPSKVVNHIISMPGVGKVLDQGERKVSLVLDSGLQLDFLITDRSSFGALLQHFTGSKAHNIHLRTIAEGQGLSLSEYGIKKIKNEEIIKTKTEEEFYKTLGMDWIPAEIREDTGEIEAALQHNLPALIELSDIKGDFHIHSNFPIEPSHDLGASSIEEIRDFALKLGYQYVGLSEHSPSVSNHTPTQIKTLIEKKKYYIEHNVNSDNIRVLNLLEVDIQPDGSLSIPDDSLKILDFALAGVHSLHRQPKEAMTKRILRALSNPYVKILTHPTGRLINQREGYEADWEEIFKFAALNNKAIEINSYPDRLDLAETMIRMATSLGTKLAINTDSHEVSQMQNMKFGVAMARRGWATVEDIINCWDWTKLSRWLKINE